MSFAEDLTLFFPADGPTVEIHATIGTASIGPVYGYLDQPTQIALAGRALGEAPSFVAARAELPGLARGNAVTVDGDAYTVREIEVVDDGAVVRVVLAS